MKSAGLSWKIPSQLTCLSSALTTAIWLPLHNSAPKQEEASIIIPNTRLRMQRKSTMTCIETSRVLPSLTASWQSVRVPELSSKTTTRPKGRFPSEISQLAIWIQIQWLLSPTSKTKRLLHLMHTSNTLAYILIRMVSIKSELLISHYQFIITFKTFLNSLILMQHFPYSSEKRLRISRHNRFNRFRTL